MYQILFVDMDTQICQLLQEIDWNAYGIQTYYLAHSISRGQELAIKYYPDIVITELRFRDESAMAMMRKILSIHPNCRFIVYTKYAYGEDLIEAIELGCFRCVIKNIPWTQMDNLLDTINQLTQQMRKEHHQEQQYQQMQLQTEQYYLLAQTAYINLFLSDFDKSDRNQLASILEKFHFPLEAHSYLFCINDFNPQEMLLVGENEQVQFLLHDCVKNWLKDNQNTTIFVTMDQQHSVIIHDVNNPSFMSLEEIVQTIKEFNQTFVNKNQLPLHSGLSSLVDTFDQLPKAFRLAQCAARYGVLHNLSVVSFSEFCIDENEYHAMRPMLHYLVCILELNQSFTKILEHIVFTVSRWKPPTEFLQMIAIDFMIELYKHFSTKFDHWFYYKEVIMQIQDIESFQFFMKQQILTIDSSHMQLSDMNQTSIIHQAKLYIQTHYSEELTLPIVAKQIPVSSSYLSSLFQKKGEVGFKEYILFCRIQAAKELLEFTLEKIDSIAKQVGFSNTKYFSTCFKQKTGLTPSAYRNYYRKKSEHS